jgi:tetratricopeptide (TPR) repeat protein
VGEPEKALDLIQREAIGKVDDPADRLRIFYALAMIHSRFLKTPDYGKAEQYIDCGLEVIEESELPEEQKLILRVFTLNGLAFIRHRQGRPQEAVELCRNGFELLRDNLPEEEHRLHRSVLLYNIGQVYYALHMHEEAVRYYSAAIEFDPNYSEYYNERGNIFLMMERYGDAVADYREAIRLSAPYQEVWTNMGQAFKRAGNFPAALEAYSRALDLDPDKLLPRVGRAQSYESLGRAEEAIADYSTALELDPNQPMVLGNRACLYFDAGQAEAALTDLNRAIAIAPEDPDLLGNRAFLLESRGLRREAVEDLRAYLRLKPDAEDREEIEAKILSLSSAGLPPSVGEALQGSLAAG